jgi:hypothetical protein
MPSPRPAGWTGERGWSSFNLAEPGGNILAALLGGRILEQSAERGSVLNCLAKGGQFRHRLLLDGVLEEVIIFCDLSCFE